jgi:8-oxo-dGTP diphosphatase
LIKRVKNQVAEGNKYALPGGYVDLNETTKQAVLRETQEETGYEAITATFLTFGDDPNRDKRQTITIVYEVEVGEKVGEPDKEVSKVEWVDLDYLPPKDQFAFDHYQLIKSYIAH